MKWMWADAEHLLQAYVIATSTLVDISKVDVSKFDDTYFKSTEKKEKKKSEDGFFGEQTDEKKELSPEYVENQKKVNLTAIPILGFCFMHVLNSGTAPEFYCVCVHIKMIILLHVCGALRII